ncbi:MAG: response regulator, partial [Calditrichaeota bacterium]
MSKRVLIVDDDANILESYKRFFRREYQIETALGGQAGLEAIEKSGQPFAVLVSDMRMPGINGAQFLSAARKLSPDSVRMLLTGHADLDDAINAINQGHIFRFLTKPCPPAAFKAALDDGIKQYQLITSERELLDKTLKGSVKLLVDILSVAIPDAFNRSLRVRKLTGQVAARLGLKNLWEVDLAVLFSQIGCVTMPVDIVKKAYQGQPLSPSEQELFSGHMEVGRELLANIPRLQSVAEAVAYQAK